MSTIATSSPVADHPTFGVQLWLSAPTSTGTAAPAGSGRAANSPRPAMREGRASATVLKSCSPGRPAPSPAAAQVVGHDELAERTAFRLEHPAAVAGAELLHERYPPRVVVEHEHVDRGALAGAALDLGQGGGDRLRCRGPGELGEAVGGE